MRFSAASLLEELHDFPHLPCRVFRVPLEVDHHAANIEWEAKEGSTLRGGGRTAGRARGRKWIRQLKDVHAAVRDRLVRIALQPPAVTILQNHHRRDHHALTGIRA